MGRRRRRDCASATYAAFNAFDDAVKERGAWCGGEALTPPTTARTLGPGPDRAVTEGPYAETVEQLGGFYVIDVADLDTARRAGRAAAGGVHHRGPRVPRRRGDLTWTPPTALETLLRDEWGRLLALLVARFRRLDLAEDALGDAFEAAARRWPEDGVPANPPAWLLTAARRRVLDRLRAEAVAARTLPVLAVEADLTEEARRVMADGTSPGEPRARSTSGCGWCCCAPTRRWPPRPPPR